MYEFLLPVIQVSTDVTQDQYVYLAEDGLELWLETLKNSPNPNDHLLQLYRNMPGLLGKLQNDCTCTNSDWLQAPALLRSVSGIFIVVIYKNDKTWSYFDLKIYYRVWNRESKN